MPHGSSRGSGGGASVSHLRVIAPVVIAAAATVLVDSFDTSRRQADYTLLIDQPASPKLSKVEVNVVSDGITPTHSCPSHDGDPQDYNTDVILDGGLIKLNITNNEANPITVSGFVID